MTQVKKTAKSKKASPAAKNTAKKATPKKKTTVVRKTVADSVTKPVASLTVVSYKAQGGKESAAQYKWSSEDAGSVAKNIDSLTQAVEDICEVNKEQAEVVLEYVAKTANLYGAMSDEVSAYFSNVISGNMRSAESLLACKDVNELLSLQADMTRKSVEDMFNSLFRFSDILVGFSKELEPANEKAMFAAQKLSKTCAV